MPPLACMHILENQVFSSNKLYCLAVFLLQILNLLLQHLNDLLAFVASEALEILDISNNLLSDTILYFARHKIIKIKLKDIKKILPLILFNYSALQYTILLKFNFTSFCVTLVNFSGSYTLTLIGYFSSNYAAKHSLQPRKSFSNLLHTVYILLVY